MFQRLDRPFNFLGFGEPPELVFREHQRVVDADVEHAILAADELRLNTEALFQGRGQTGRAR